MTDHDGDRPEKRPLTPLAGPYGHPFHPIAVTVPIGAWVASFVVDIVGSMSADPSMWAVTSRILIAIGLIGCVFAIFFGILDYVRIPDRTRASSTATFHMAINLAVCGGYAVQLMYRFSTEEIPVGGVVLSGISLALLAVSGWLGGKLSYRWGIRVADETTQAEAYRLDEAPSDSRR